MQVVKLPRQAGGPQFCRQRSGSHIRIGEQAKKLEASLHDSGGKTQTLTSKSEDTVSCDKELGPRDITEKGGTIEGKYDTAEEIAQLAAWLLHAALRLYGIQYTFSSWQAANPRNSMVGVVDRH